MPSIIHSFLAFGLAFSNITVSSPLQRRQESVETYISQVRTAIYAVGSIDSGYALEACTADGLAEELDKSGLDGDYALQLMCQAAAGIEVFPDLAAASDNLHEALAYLLTATCADLDVTTMNDAGLDDWGMQEAVCRASATPSDPMTTRDVVLTASSTSSMEAGPSTEATTSLPGVLSILSVAPSSSSSLPASPSSLAASIETSSLRATPSFGSFFSITTETMTKTSSPEPSQTAPAMEDESDSDQSDKDDGGEEGEDGSSPSGVQITTTLSVFPWETAA